jgi:hypothetical protein
MHGAQMTHWETEVRRLFVITIANKYISSHVYVPKIRIILTIKIQQLGENGRGGTPKRNHVNGSAGSACQFHIRVIQSCHLLANYRGTYFPTYSIMKSRRSAISGIMNFVDDYSYCPTYCVTYCSAYPPLPFCIQTPNDFFFFYIA